MTETPERADEPATSPVDTLPPPAHIEPDPHPGRTTRLFQVAAWVAIVAGTLFIVGAVFFTGFFLGRHSGGPGHGGGRHHEMGQFHERMAPPMMPFPPGQMGPGMRPGQIGPGATPPPATAPARP